MISFTVPGDPVAKGRPRFAKVGAYVRTYTPERTTRFEDRVAYHFQQCGPYSRLEGAVILEVDCYFRRPQRLMGKKWPDGPMLAPKRPDADNCGKSVMDALNGLAYADDGQVVDLRVRKFYHEKGGAQRTGVRISVAQP